MKNRSYNSTQTTNPPLRRLWVLLCTMMMPLGLAAEDHANRPTHHHYKLIDLGTFGDPASYFSNGFDGILNNRGTAVGWADTPTPDPHPATCFDPDCFVAHAFRSQNGVLADLGALPGGGSSQAVWISANGLIAGFSQIAESDPSIPGGPAEVRAVLWRNSVLTDLGMLPQGGFDTFASAVNSRGEVVGWGVDTTPDPFCLAAPGFCTTQTRAFRWENGAMQDLGTLGGADAQASLVNEGGQIVGISYTNSTQNSVTGIPTVDPFFWEHGTMVDLGTLGGTFGSPSALNNRGEVVGQSNLAGDLTSHPFLWIRTGGMQDLGTLGGNNGLTNWINDAGAIAGKADLPGPLPQNHDAVLWRHGSMVDLGTLPGDSCSNAYYVNSRGQVVGTSESRDLCLIPTGEHAFLWQDGGPMVDLNSLIAPGSNLELTFAFAINDSGEIVGTGIPSGCTPANIDFCGHAYMLMPCDESHPDIEGCDYSPVEVSTVAASHATETQKQLTPQEVSRIRALTNRHRGFMPKTMQ
jgi:probable HAF family extracellular repeat protein